MHVYDGPVQAAQLVHMRTCSRKRKPSPCLSHITVTFEMSTCRHMQGDCAAAPLSNDAPPLGCLLPAQCVIDVANDTINFFEVLKIPVAPNLWLHNLALLSPSYTHSAINWDPRAPAAAPLPTLRASALTTRGWRRGINALDSVFAQGVRPAYACAVQFDGDYEVLPDVRCSYPACTVDGQQTR